MRELTNREYDLAERLCDIRHAVDRGEDGIGVVGENDGCPACRAAVIALVDAPAVPEITEGDVDNVKKLLRGWRLYADEMPTMTRILALCEWRVREQGEGGK